jgi:hypothetical protein
MQAEHRPWIAGSSPAMTKKEKVQVTDEFEVMVRRHSPLPGGRQKRISGP